MIMPIEAHPNIGYDKLSRKFFMNLPTGVFLVSNCYIAPKQPIFAQYVLPLPKRETQWRRICVARANQRKCHIFRGVAAFQQWLHDHPVPPPQP